MSYLLRYIRIVKKMSKESANRRSSVPPFRQQLTRWHFRPMPFSTTERAKMESWPYKKAVRHWLEVWDPFNEGVALDSYKNGRALIRETTIDGGEKLQEFRRQTVPEQTRLELLAWAKNTVADCDSTLQWLFERYQINPIDVLDTVGSWKAYMVKYRPVIDASVHARSEKARQQQAGVLTEAANILKIWKPLLPFIYSLRRSDPADLEEIAKIPRCPDPAELEAIATALRELGPSQAHTLGKLEIKLCARNLTQLFRKKASLPLPEHVGAIITAAFPAEWNPKGDLKEATKKLVKQRSPQITGHGNAHGRRKA